MTGKPAGILQKPGQGFSYWLLGDLYTYKIVGQETNQAYALCEIIMKPQSEVPPHIHSHEAEAFYIQEGEMEFQLGEKIIIATPGTFLHSPQGELHRFKNIGSKPAKFLSWVTPAGFDNFIIEAGVPAIEIEDKIPEVSPENIEKVMATASKYGIKII